jgi:hypothetical protein
MAPTHSKFVETEASTSSSKSKGREFGSPSSKKKFKPMQMRGAVPVLIKIMPSMNGYVQIIFPKEHADLRELLKAVIIVDCMVVIEFHWGPKAWGNILPTDKNKISTPNTPVLTCDPIRFIEAAGEALDRSEYCSSWQIMGPNGNTITMDDVHELDFNLPAVVEPREEAEASTDDLQSDLRVLYRLMTLFAKRAGISQEEIESCQEDP